MEVDGLGLWQDPISLSLVEGKTMQDITKPWKRQFFKVTKIADEPPLNVKGFWDKPKPGVNPKDVLQNEKRAPKVDR